MKEKIIARIKEKFPKINLSKARLDAIADKMKVTEESEIDDKLDELNDIFPFAELAKQDDRIRGLEKKDQKPADEKKPDSESEKSDSENPEVPAWAKGLVEMLPKLSSRLEAIENGKTGDTRKSQLETALKDAPESYRTMILKDFARIPFENDDKFKEYLDEKVADSAEFVQTEANNGLGGINRPIVPSGGNNKQATKEELDKIMPNII